MLVAVPPSEIFYDRDTIIYIILPSPGMIHTLPFLTFSIESGDHYDSDNDNRKTPALLFGYWYFDGGFEVLIPFDHTCPVTPHGRSRSVTRSVLPLPHR